MLYMPSIFDENLMDGFFSDFTRPAKTRFVCGVPTEGFMKTDVRETEEGYELAVELPGYKKEDVKARLKDGYMTITAETTQNQDEKDENGKFIRRERYTGKSSRSFYVGKEITEEDIKAKFEDGILKIDVPKKQPEPKSDEQRYISIA